jgi:DNA polymerase-3 subunit epsilon
MAQSRQIVLDTETTGLEPAQGHRIIEIGCVELVGRRVTGNHFHYYLNPDRDIDEGAREVHGIDAAFLSDKPRFTDVAEEFLTFITDAELIIHNAPFDVGFLNNELERLQGRRVRIEERCTVCDTLTLARKMHPGQKNSLDALCKRYGIDNSQRELHGALLDAEILADVYLAMTGGQATLSLEAHQPGTPGLHEPLRRMDATRPPLRVIRATADEVSSHRARLQAIDKESAGRCLWAQIEAAE